MITEHEQRSNHAVSYAVDGKTLTVTVDGETTAYDLPTGDGFMPDPPFPIQRAERRNGELIVHVIRTLNARGEPHESEPGEPVSGAVDWQPLPTPTKAELHQYLAQLGRRRRLALVGLSPNDPDVDSAEMMLQVEQAMLQNKRETGRTNASENARLDDELEPLAVSMLTEWQAQQAIKAKIKDDTYTTTDDIDNAREWP